MDPLSDVLSLLKPRSYTSGALQIGAEIAIEWPEHAGIKCYAVASGQCWLSVEGVSDPALLTTGDCFLLPPGPAFCLSADLSLPRIDFKLALALGDANPQYFSSTTPACCLLGGHFIVEGTHATLLLQSLPPIVHIRNEADKAAMRWSLERMKEEVQRKQPGSSLITRQLACMMLVQALRLHMAHRAATGWLSALADAQIGAALACIHDQPGHPWSLESLAACAGMSRSIFASRFKEAVEITPMEYLGRWRMQLAAERLRNSDCSISEVASTLGYRSESAFGKAFRRVMGCSPRQYTRADPRLTPPHTAKAAEAPAR